MNAQWVLAWWNLIFIVPFALALMYLGVYTLSGWTFGESDIDADTDADFDADVDTDADFQIDHGLHLDNEVEADADADADIDTNLDGDHDTDAQSGGGSSSVWAALTFLGVGTVPISIVLMILLFVWGTVGFLVNQIARPHVAQGWQVAFASLPAAFVASVLMTSFTSRVINRVMPLNITQARRRHELLGSTGEVILPVDEKFGMASVRDESGDLFQVPCRLERAHQPVPKGARVKFVAYDARESLFYVLPA